VEAKTRSGIGPAKPGRPGQFFFYCQSLNDVVFILLKWQNVEDNVKKNEAKSFTIGKPNLLTL
jgi:hypothetical protein